MTRLLALISSGQKVYFYTNPLLELEIFYKFRKANSRDGGNRLANRQTCCKEDRTNFFMSDLLNFVGRRINEAHRRIKPDLDSLTDYDNFSLKEFANLKEGMEREAIYMLGLADGLELSRNIGRGRRLKQKESR